MASEQVSIFSETVINKIITLPNKSAQDLRKPILIIRLNWLIVVDEMVWKQYARTFCFANDLHLQQEGKPLRLAK